MTTAEMATTLGRVGWYFCSLKGEFKEHEHVLADDVIGVGRRRKVRKRGRFLPRHKTALQANRLGAWAKSPERNQIFDTYVRVIGHPVEVDESTEPPF